VTEFVAIAEHFPEGTI